VSWPCQSETKKISESSGIPTSYKEGMRMPARIVATEKLIREMDAGVFDTSDQTSPPTAGILSMAYCMPDGHWGYGFTPSVGVVGHGCAQWRHFPGWYWI